MNLLTGSTDILRQELIQLTRMYGDKARQGELVAFPTETVYGIGANALDKKAVANIFRIKERPADNPLIVHVSSIKEIESVAQTMSQIERKIYEKFAPGPITVILKKRRDLPRITTAGLDSIGVRIPNHPLALAFLKAAGVPIAAPSANKSGKPSATHHKHVEDAFGRELPNIIKGGQTTFGVESTVVTAEESGNIVILRQGAISKEDLQEAFPNNVVLLANDSNKDIKASPGTHYKHYAPKGTLELLPYVFGVKETFININATLLANKNDSIAILCSDEVANLISNNKALIIRLGSEKNLSDIAKNLYSALIECDQRGVDYIYSQSFLEGGIGRTIMERLSRASQ